MVAIAAGEGEIVGFSRELPLMVVAIGDNRDRMVEFG